MANSGALQIELIQQHDERPSIYREFLASGREGMQHVLAWETCSGFDEKKARFLREGVELAQECTIPASGVRLAYFATEGRPGRVYELADLLEPDQYERIQNIASAAEAWDGSDPVREVRA